ncbi:MAG: hypothetical protein KGD73_03155 [Candidatus Lokiarchaeota archaeon]|nr:hypothetical protein [Candidatus Lokiarchaeota archaeon]
MIEQKVEEKKVQTLSTPCLIAIRANFRKILWLWFRREFEHLEDLSFKAIKVKDRELNKSILKEQGELYEVRHKTPISCVLCNDFEANLVYEPKRRTWFCIVCYNDAHNLYPDEYP